MAGKQWTIKAIGGLPPVGQFLSPFRIDVDAGKEFRVGKA